MGNAMTLVWGVYFEQDLVDCRPPTESLWSTPEKAQRRADELNSQRRRRMSAGLKDGGWSVMEWELDCEPGRIQGLTPGEWREIAEDPDLDRHSPEFDPPELRRMGDKGSILLDLVRGHVQLHQRGDTWEGRCPFHDDKATSFSVHPGKGLFYCFGCHAGGDAVSFLMKLEGKTFAEAVKNLALWVEETDGQEEP
jgi:hypothetical protein